MAVPMEDKSFKVAPIDSAPQEKWKMVLYTTRGSIRPIRGSNRPSIVKTVWDIVYMFFWGAESNHLYVMISGYVYKHL